MGISYVWELSKPIEGRYGKEHQQKDWEGLSSEVERSCGCRVTEGKKGGCFGKEEKEEEEEGWNTVLCC